jgi:serine O-acetyltransferase
MGPRVRASLSEHALAALVSKQVEGLFPDGHDIDTTVLAPSVRRALMRLEHCFTQIANKYFFDGKRAIFDHLHGDQYAMWLYILSSQLYVDSAPLSICKKVFLLNKALHGCDIFYEVELPSVFLLVHPLGTVLGRAKYSDYLIAYQRVGVGSNHEIYPNLGPHLTLRPGSSVLGNCRVEKGCSIAAESLLIDRDLAADSIYIGNPRDYHIVQRKNVQPIWRSA